MATIDFMNFPWGAQASDSAFQQRLLSDYQSGSNPHIVLNPMASQYSLVQFPQYTPYLQFSGLSGNYYTTIPQNNAPNISLPATSKFLAYSYRPFYA